MGEGSCVDESAGAGGRGEKNAVCCGKEALESDVVCCAERSDDRVWFGNEVVVVNVHAEAMSGPSRDLLANVSEADEAKSPAAKVVGLESCVLVIGQEGGLVAGDGGGYTPW